MTIEKGKDWGTSGPLASDAPIVDSDQSLAALFSVDGGRLVGPTEVGLVGGDLATTVGARGTPEQLSQGVRTRLPIDLGIVEIDGDAAVVAASIVIRNSWWRGALDGALNASYLGSWNVSPTGHPNDGRFDVISARLSLSDRLKARPRLASGSHVPHPGIAIRRLRQTSWDVNGARVVYLDGRPFRGVKHVTLTVVPDATIIVI